ncbi:MAG: TlpA disulfide reductase family protein [Planctomycetota bacterium]
MRVKRLALLIMAWGCLTGFSLAQTAKPDAFAREFEKIKASWGKKGPAFLEKMRAYQASQNGKPGGDLKVIGWVTRHRPKFKPFSNRLKRLVTRQPGHAMAQSAMLWNVENTNDYFDSDWVYERMLAPDTKFAGVGPLFQTMALDPRDSVTPRLEAWMACKEQAWRHFALRALITHIRVRAVMRLLVKRADKVRVRAFQRRLGTKAFVALRESSVQVDEALYIKVLEAVAADPARAWVKFKGQKHLRMMAADHLETVRRLEVGKPLPKLVGTSIRGSEVTARDGEGKVQLIVFWGSWSPESATYAATQKLLAERHANKPFRTVSVNCHDDIQVVRDFIKKNDVSWPTLGDPEGSYVGSWSVWEFPYAFLVDHQGIIRAKGSLEEPEILKISAELLADVAP